MSNNSLGYRDKIDSSLDIPWKANVHQAVLETIAHIATFNLCSVC